MASKKKITEKEFPSNSISKRVIPMRDEPEEETQSERPLKRPRKVIRTTTAMVKRKTFVESVASLFVGNDTQNIGSYILYDILLPSAKSMIQEMVTTGIEMLLNGGERRVSGSRSSRRDNHTVISYGSFYDDGRKSRRSARSTNRERFDLDDVYFRHGDEATEVLDALCDQLEEYGQVTVADFYDQAGIDGATWAHSKYGWDNLSKAYCSHTRNGYCIVFPNPVELE